MTVTSPEDRAAEVAPVPRRRVRAYPPGADAATSSSGPRRASGVAAPDRAADTSLSSPTKTRRAQPSPLPPEPAQPAAAGTPARIPGSRHPHDRQRHAGASGRVTAGDPAGEPQAPAAAFSARAAAGQVPAGGARLASGETKGASPDRQPGLRGKAFEKAVRDAQSAQAKARRAGRGHYRARSTGTRYVPGGNRRDPAPGGEQR